MQLSPQEKDLLVRTVIGEAADQSPEGQAGVAYSVLNRLKDGGYGRTAAQVILAPNQYEPWQTRAAELTSIPTNSRAYARASKLVDGVLNGEVEDPTGGATHFLNEDIVRQRRGGSLPSWAQGEGQRIGAHTFFAPGGQPMAYAQKQSEVPDYLSEFIKQASPKEGAVSVVPAAKEADIPDYLSEFIKAAPEAPKAAPVVAQAPPKEPAPPLYAVDPSGKEVVIAPPEPQNSPASMIPRPARDYGNRVMQLLGENASLAGEGLKDITQNKSASGVAKTALGTLGYLGAPINAIDEPIGKAVGNKEFGERAALVVPALPLGKLANAARPTVGAVKDLVRDIGPDALPQVIQRLESNPKLTLMDVAPAVRGNAAGLATDPRNVSAMTHLNKFQKERMGERGSSTAAAFEDVLGPTPNVKETVDAIKAQAQKTGKELIEPAVASIKELNVAPVIKSIDDRIPPSMLADLKAGREPPAMPDEAKRLWNLRERLRGDAKEGDVILADPKKVHNLQSELRLSSGDPQIGYHARSVRRELVTAMDEASGGKYKPALKQYADDKAVDEAFRHGFEIFSNPTSAEKSLANHPDMWKAWASDASKAELEAAKKGAMIGAKIRILNMRRGIDVPEGGFTHERLSAIVGDKEANKVVQTLNDWRDISETDNLLTKNSATAIRQAGQEARAVREPRSGKDILQSMMPAAVVGGAAHMASGGSPILTGVSAATALGLGKTANYLGRTHDLASNKAYAQWASATGQKKDELLDILREASRKSQPVSKGEKLMNLVPPALLQSLPR